MIDPDALKTLIAAIALIFVMVLMQHGCEESKNFKARNEEITRCKVTCGGKFSSWDALTRTCTCKKTL